jgi:tetratricopeptide (TPR) repeat protein
LRSVAAPHDPGPNREALKALESAVEIDPKYAPAWAELGQRYYYDATYSTGGEQAIQKSNEALERATRRLSGNRCQDRVSSTQLLGHFIDQPVQILVMTLDPNLIAAASQLVVNRVDSSVELVKAYEEATALVKRRPESAQAHFTLGYVQRYAGMLEESARQCETALALTPGNQFRSCAWAFMYLGQLDKAREFTQLDAGSEWANWATSSLLLREGKVAEAREAVKLMSNFSPYLLDLMEAAVGLRPPSELDRIAHDAEINGPTFADPEITYHQGAIFAYSGKRDAAFHVLKAAIQSNYCAYSQLLTDPLLRGLHDDRRYDELLTAAHECQQAVQAGAPQSR